MCLEGISEKKVAEENIFCWKRLKRSSGKSYLRNYVYKPGILQPRVIIQPLYGRYSRGGTIEAGYHSWVELQPKSRSGYPYSFKALYLFVIPKGTVYYEGSENGDAKGYASESIVYLGHIYNPLTWIRKFG